MPQWARFLFGYGDYMFVGFSKASFRLLIRAITVGILIPSLLNEQYYAFIVTVCVFALGQMIEYISFIENTVSKTVHLICSVGCLLAIIVSVICFVYFAGLAINADSNMKSIIQTVDQDENASESIVNSDSEIIESTTSAEDEPSPYLVFVVWVTALVSLYYVFVDFLVWVVAVLNGYRIRQQYNKSILHI